MVLPKKKVKFSPSEAREVTRLCIEENLSLRFAIKLVMDRTGENWFKVLERDYPDCYTAIKEIRDERRKRKGFA